MSSIQTADELAASARAGGAVPSGLAGPVKALWLCKADRWDEAHEVAQDLGSRMGDWIHGLLHLIEGDIGNSAYWYSRARQPQPELGEIDQEWRKIAEAALEAGAS